jgi:hypothetical protein
MNYELQAFRFEVGTRNSEPSYRFAVVDYSKAREYPANFVCMLPLKIELVKGKSLNTFGELFGEKSTDLAIELLKKALLREKDAKIKLELEKRLKLLDPTLAGKVKCNGCGKTFESARLKKYKRPFCSECYQKRFSRKV